jgi:hypothetical protein
MRRLTIGFVVGSLALVGTVYAVLPRRANLLMFDPAVLAQTETSMWKHYYDRRYPWLFYDLYSISRAQYGFSPLDSARIAVAAARAARAFQPSRSRSEAEAALPYLTEYFRLLSSAAPVSLDVDAAARLELSWWQARREDVGPDEYGVAIARIMTLVYGVDDAKVRQAGVLRAKAMAYRDAKGSSVTDADWTAINDQLDAAYTPLKQALPVGQRQRRGDSYSMTPKMPALRLDPRVDTGFRERSCCNTKVERDDDSKKRIPL